MWTSSTPDAASSAPTWVSTGSAAISRLRCRRLSFKFERVHHQLLAGHDLDVESATRRAAKREVEEGRLGAARAAPARGRHVLDHELGSLHRRAGRRELERATQRRGHDLAEVADPHLHPAYPSPPGVGAGDANDRLGYRELAHPSQMRGRGAP